MSSVNVIHNALSLCVAIPKSQRCKAKKKVTVVLDKT